MDDTLIKTKASVKVYSNDGDLIKSLRPDEFNVYKKKDGEVLDFADFVSRDIILDATPFKMWPLMKEIDREITEEGNNADLYILTGRTNHVQLAIFELFKSWGVKNLVLENIICMGDGRGDIDVPKEKKKILKEMSAPYDAVLFFDDDEDNIKTASGLKNIKTKLVETGI